MNPINNDMLENICKNAYTAIHNYPKQNLIIDSENLFAICRELIELRALRDGKPAFTPSVIGEAAQAGAVCNDTEAFQPSHYDPAWQDRVKSHE